MPFKISNETKIGALTAITITLFILGFNFLKGKSPLKKARYVYARFHSIEGLVASNSVIMNGLTVGNVYATSPGDEELNSVVVTIRLTEAIKIPINSIAQIKSNPLGAPAIEIVKGDARTFVSPGDTLATIETPGLFGSIFDKLAPTQKALDKLLISLDSIAAKVNTTLTPGVQDDLKVAMQNLRSVSGELNGTMAGVNKLVSANGSLAKTLDNANDFSASLVDNKQKIGNIASNLEAGSAKLAELDLKATVDQLNLSVASLKATLEKLNDPGNTAGALLNDRRMYDNLNSSINSLNLLLQDLRLHPKRYVQVSVFGKKDKSEPLMKPMAEDSATREQFKNQ
jgi:phospholipid/cholesterol/gamma-HCH transport system substrate-binding protein